MENQNNSTPEAVKPITLQSILECKEGTSSAMGKILTGASNNEQLQRMSDYQTQCLQNFKILEQKLSQEAQTDSNIKLADALQKTQNRIVLEQKMIKFLIKSDSPGAGIQMGEEMLGFVFAAKMVAPQENQAWGEYKQALEAEKMAPPKGNTDFMGWGLLIIMLFIVGRALMRKQILKDEQENNTNKKGPL